MADLLTRVQRELDERMAALRPLVEEAEQLEQALEALNGAPSSHAPAAALPVDAAQARRSAPRPQAGPSPAVREPATAEAQSAEPAADDSDKTARSRISREQADERRRQALAVITENPGTTASTLALLLDTSTGTMHSLLKRLESEGEIEKADKGYARSKQPAES